MLLTTLLLAAALSSAESQSPTWHAGTLESALDLAKVEERGVLVYFWMAGSDHCTRLWNETLNTEAGTEQLSAFVCVSADVAAPAGRDLVGRFGITTLPTLLFVGADGAPDDAILGYIASPTFASELQRIRDGRGTVGALRADAARDPTDLDRRFRLAIKLRDIGDSGRSDELFDSIKAEDPHGRTVIGAQLLLWDVQNEIATQARDVSDPLTYDLEPLYDHVARIRPDAVRFEAWDWAARLERRRGNRAQALRAFRRAWDYLSDAARNDWGNEVFGFLWASRDDLAAADRRFGLEVARAAVAQAEAMPSLDPATNFVLSGEDYTAYHAGTLDLLARALWLNGKRTEAREALDRALAMEPDNNDWIARERELFGDDVQQSVD